MRFLSLLLFLPISYSYAASSDGITDQTRACSHSTGVPVRAASLDHRDVHSPISNHDSDDEELKASIAEARELLLDTDFEVKRALKEKRQEKKDEAEREKAAEYAARKATFLAKLGPTARRPNGGAGQATSTHPTGEPKDTTAAAGPTSVISPSIQIALDLLAKDLLKPEMTRELRGNIVSTIASIPQEDRVSVVGYVQRLTARGIYWDWTTDIIKAVSRVKLEDRAIFEDFFKKFINPTMEYEDFLNTITSLANFSSADNLSMGNYTEKLLRYPANRKHLADIINTIGSIPAPERENIVTYVQRLLTPSMHGKHISGILRTIAAIRPDEREDILTNAHPFIETAKTEAIPEILSSIAKIPASERKIFLAQLKPFSRTDALPKITSFLANLLPENRASLLDYTKILIPDWMMGEAGIKEVMEAISKISLLDRDEFVKVIQLLVKPTMHFTHVQPIIVGLATVPSEYRAPLARLIKSIMSNPKLDQGQMPLNEGYYVHNFINSLKTLDPKEYQFLEKQIDDLTFPGMKIDEFFAMSSTLTEIATEEREVFIKLIKVFISPIQQDQWTVLLSKTIKTLRSLPASEREITVTRLLNKIPSALTQDERAAVMVRLINERNPIIQQQIIEEYSKKYKV